jgi:hypothetical protein
MPRDYEWSAEELTELLIETQKTDRDNLLAVDGGTGTGKSTLGLKLCIRACPWFDMEKDILYSRDEIINWVTVAKPGSWGLADEAVNALFKRDFAGKGQKFLLKILDMCRDRNLTLIFCIPNFWALDKHLLEGRIRMRIHVAKTGMAFMWKPDPNPFAQDKWYRKYNEKVCYNWADHYNARRTKGFMGYIQFGDLAEKYKQPYLAIKKAKKEMIKKLEEAQEEEEAKNKTKSVEIGKMVILEELESSGLIRPGWMKTLAAKEGITAEALSMRFQRWKKKQQVGEESDETNEENNIKYYNNTLKELNFDETSS